MIIVEYFHKLSQIFHLRGEENFLFSSNIHVLGFYLVVIIDVDNFHRSDYKMDILGYEGFSTFLLSHIHIFLCL